MIRAINKYLPDTVFFNTPKSGMFLWLELPEEINTQEMIDNYSLEDKVLMVPGSAFSSGSSLINCMRLSFSLVTPEQIHEGIRRLADMIEKSV